MKVRREIFQVWANHFHEKVVDMDNSEQDVCIAPVLFWSIQSINHGGYLPRDESPKLTNPRTVGEIMGISLRHALHMSQLTFRLTEHWPSELLRTIDVGAEM